MRGKLARAKYIQHLNRARKPLLVVVLFFAVVILLSYSKNTHIVVKGESQKITSYAVAENLKSSQLEGAISIEDNKLIGPENFKAKVTSKETYFEYKDQENEDQWVRGTLQKAEKPAKDSKQSDQLDPQDKAAAKTEREKITYEGVFDGVNVEQSVYEGRIKESVIIRDENSPRKFEYKIEASDKLKLKQDDSGVYLAKNNDKQPAVLLEDPYAIDANGTKFNFKYTVSGNKLVVEPDADLSGAIYPLNLDPSYTVYVGITNFSSATQRKIARDSSGNYYMVYQRNNGSKENIYIAKSSNQGQTWTETAITNEADYDQKTPAIAIDGNNYIHVTWLGQTADNGVYYQLKYRKYTTSWQAIETLTNQNYSENQPAIAVDSSNNVHIAWTGGIGSGTSTLNYLKYTTSWQAVEQLTTAATDGVQSANAAIAIGSDDHIHIAWKGRHSGSTTYYQIRYIENNGSGWQTIVNLTSESVNQDPPQIALDSSNNPHVVWFGWHSGTSVEQIRYRYHNGSSWQAVQNLTSGDSYDQKYPSISIDSSNNVHVMWMGPFDETWVNGLWHRVYSSSWSAAENLLPGSNASIPSLLWAGNPTVSGSKTNRPSVGYVAGWAVSTTLYFAESSDLSWTDAPSATVPDAPTAVSATAGNGQATVSFTAPANDGGADITGYTVTSSPGSITATGTSSPITVTGLTNGTSYTFTVHATNSVGDSAESTASNSVTPITVPDAPTAVSATAGNGQATVSFTAPANDGGADITGYTVTSSPGSITATGTSSPITVTGLTNGTSYTFTVHATNSVGDSAESTASSAVMPGVTISGTVYTAKDESTNIGANKTVALYVGGRSKVTVETTTGGAFSFPLVILTADQPYSIFLDDETEKGSLVSVAADSTSNISHKLYTNEIVVTSNDANPISNADLRTADNHADADCLYTSNDSLNIVTFNESYELWLPTGKSYTFDNGISAGDYDIDGTLSGSGYVIVKGDFDASGSILNITANFNLYGSSLQTITTNNGSANDMIITNNSEAGVVFTDGLSISGGLTATQASTKVTFNASSIYSFGSININGQATGTRSTFASSSPGNHYHFNVAAASPSLSYVNIADADASGGNQITATTGCWDAGGNTNFVFSVPDAPTNISATAGDTQATVTFTPPTNTGSSNITGYTVTSTPGSITATGASSPITITGLTNGTSYTFTVYATNTAGNSAESSSSNSVTPATTPTVTTQSATNITQTSATLNGNTTATGGVNSTVRGFKYSTAGQQDDYDISSNGDFDTGSFTESLTSITAGTTVYFRAYATNAAGTSYGDWASFVTSVPTVTLNGSTSISENSGSATITALLSNASSQNVTIGLTFTGTATNTSDYSRSATSITINAGATSGSITISGVDDTLDENDETVIVAVDPVTNGSEDGVQEATVTITDNDDAPTIAFTSASGSGAESTTSVNLPVSLSTTSGLETSVNYSVTGGTATGNGTDYTLTSGTATIAAGETSTNIALAITNDTLDENDETIIVTLVDPTNSSLGANTTYTYTVNDNDEPPTVGFDSGAASNAESVTSASIGLSISAASGLEVSIPYSVTGGTATGNGTDYTLTSGTATIAAGETTATITLSVVDDSLDENSETVIVTLGSPTNATSTAASEYTYTITDNDDAPTIAFTSASGSGAESTTSVNLPVSLSTTSGLETSVNYSVTGGTATGNGTDYTLTSGTATIAAGETSTNIALAITNDTLDENDETIIVTLVDPTNSSLGANTTYTYTVNDNDEPPTVGFASASGSQSEAITTTLLRANISEASGKSVTVNYNVSGTATGGGVDYSLSSGTITIQAGETFANIPVIVKNDSLDEENETIIITLSDPINATLGTISEYTYTITDNDDPPTIGFESASSSDLESATTVTIPVNLSRASGKEISIDYSVSDGTATGGRIDYLLADGTLNIPAGSTSKNILLLITNDSVVENNETIIMTLANAVNATIDISEFTYTIIDNDESRVPSSPDATPIATPASSAQATVTASSTTDTEPTVSTISTKISETAQLEVEMTNAATVSPIASQSTSVATIQSANTDNLKAYNLKILVKDSSGNPVQNARVEIHSDVKVSYSDENGYAYFENVEPGNHKVIIAYNGYKGEQSISVNGPEQKVELAVTLKPETKKTTSIALYSIGATILVMLIVFTLFILKRKKYRNKFC